MTAAVRRTMTVITNIVVIAGIAVSVAAASRAQTPPVDLEVAVVTRALQPGEVVRVDVVCTCFEGAPRASAFGIGIPLVRSQDGRRWEGFVGIDIDVAPGVYQLLVDVPGLVPAVARETPLHVAAKAFRTRTLKVAPRFVDPPAEVVARILDEASRIDTIFKTSTVRAWDGAFASPLPTPPARNFGSRSIFNGVARNPHAGVDFTSPTGTIVTAPAAGTVVLAGDLFFTGNTVIVDHGAGLYSLFAHLSSMAVAAGDVVSRGARLGQVGATGRATGPHLHWGVRLNNARVDPLSLLVATQGRPTPQR
jgi:murein DD-endopeptidase MepM/ murein hydrolase activator NlpD